MLYRSNIKSRHDSNSRTHSFSLELLQWCASFSLYLQQPCIQNSKNNANKKLNPISSWFDLFQYIWHKTMPGSRKSWSLHVSAFGAIQQQSAISKSITNMMGKNQSPIKRWFPTMVPVYKCRLMMLLNFGLNAVSQVGEEHVPKMSIIRRYARDDNSWMNDAAPLTAS